MASFEALSDDASSSSSFSLPVTTLDTANGANAAINKPGTNTGCASKRRVTIVMFLLVAMAGVFALGGLTVYFLTKDDDSSSSSSSSTNAGDILQDPSLTPSDESDLTQDPPNVAPVPIAAPAPAPVSPPTKDEEGLPPLVSVGGDLPIDELTGLPVPHEVCHGSCSTDADCAGHLICFQRSATEKVPGCAGGGQDRSETDYCVHPEVESFGGSPPQLQDGTAKLEVCQGDCDHDWDCAGHLVCHQREANEDVPGCLNGHLDSSSTDYCVVPPVTDYGKTAPRARFPLQACEGRCTADVDCGAGLVCRTHTPGSRVPGCQGRVAMLGNDDSENDGDEEVTVVTDFCVPGAKAPTEAPFALSTSAPGSDEVTYKPGELTVLKNQLMLSQGLDARLLAETSLPVAYGDGSASSWPFHARPDAGATFADPSGSGGFAYVSNSEHPDSGKGGVGAIYFDKDGNVIDYKMLLTGTRMNCGGGRSPWGTWVTNEEHDKGRIWQVDPYGTIAGGREPAPAIIGNHHGAWESFAFDTRNTTQPHFFATEDAPSGALVRHTPFPYLVDWSDPWNILHADGAVEYLVLVQGGGDSDATVPGADTATDTESGTFYWTSNRTEAKASAMAIYPNTEGIDVHDGTMYFVCKKIKMMFMLDLDGGTWTRKSTKNGLFDGGPDQLQRIVGDTRDMLFFTEEQGIEAGIHARDAMGRFYVIAASDELPGETTGLAFSPDGRFLFVAYQDTGKLFMLHRRDGKSFQAERLDVKFHHDPATAEQ